MRYQLVVLVACAFVSGAVADYKCFAARTIECGRDIGKNVDLSKFDLGVCPLKDELFNCLKNGAIACGVDKTLDFSQQRQLFDQLCTPGSEMHKKFEKYGKCGYQVYINRMSCVQSLIDYAKTLTDKSVEEMTLLIQKEACKNAKNYQNCYFSYMETDCGKDVRDFFEEIAKYSESYSEALCALIGRVGASYLL